MTRKIFINYRRSDDPGVAHLLYEQLKPAFTPAGLFLDVGDILPGEDFVKKLSDELEQSDVLLVVIGPRWDELLSARRDDKDDFVLIEIKTALNNGKLVVPVLANGAQAPKAEKLPTSIEALARRNGLNFNYGSRDADCAKLIPVLKNHLAKAAADRTQAASIYQQIAADAQRQRAERQQIMKDLQASIFDITKNVSVNSGKTAAMAFQSMDAYIRTVPKDDGDGDVAMAESLLKLAAMLTGQNDFGGARNFLIAANQVLANDLKPETAERRAERKALLMRVGEEIAKLPAG